MKLISKTKNKASLKLYNEIWSYQFEQQYDEMNGNSTLKKTLDAAMKALLAIIKKGENG